MAGKQSGSTMAEKKKPIAVIAPQKKDKSSRHVKPDKAGKDTQVKLEAQSQMRSLLYLLSITFMGFGFACVQMYHVSTMFENDRHFSHLSNLEREMTFRTEMGLYYSYYKTLIEAPTLSDGMLLILNDNVTEYPSVINTLKRFNLYPEVVIGAAFRVFTEVMSWLGVAGKQCWQVERGSGMAPVLSCEGLTDPAYFYLHAVWLCAGLTIAVLFFYAVFISGSVVGGLVTVLCFFINHGECTRVQWTPPLRESFAYPFLLLQALFVCAMLRYSKLSWRHGVGVAVTTTISLVTWQFSQFVLTTQVAALVVMFAVGVIKKHELLLILLFLAAGVQHGLLLLLGNELLASSLLVALLAASLLACVVLEPALRRLPAVPRVPLILALTAAATLVIRTRLLLAFGTSDDAHIWNLLRAKLGSYKDFHTMLYTCSAEFDFLPLAYLHKISSTLLLPSVCVVLAALALHVARYVARHVATSAQQSTAVKQDKSKTQVVAADPGLDVEPELIFTLLQLGAYVVMAVLVMRLKLFLTPQLCIIASLLVSRKYFRGIRSEGVHFAILAVLLSGMTVQGVQNITEQRSIIGEYSNIELEQLLEWVKRQTPKDAVFAGPMPLMANLLLSTRRPIVNHPHYEDANLRERTKQVYSVFSRRTPQQVYKTLSQLQVQFLVLEDTWCFSESRPGCSMTDIWDIEEPELHHQPALCPRLFLHNCAPFERVFANTEYVVLWLHSQYVEIPPLREYKL